MYLLYCSSTVGQFECRSHFLGNVLSSKLKALLYHSWIYNLKPRVLVHILLISVVYPTIWREVYSYIFYFVFCLKLSFQFCLFNCLCAKLNFVLFTFFLINSPCNMEEFIIYIIFIYYILIWVSSTHGTAYVCRLLTGTFQFFSVLEFQGSCFNAVLYW